MSGGPEEMLRRWWRRFFGLTEDDPAARSRRAQEEEEARADRYRRVREAEDEERMQRALIESVEDIAPAETDAVLRRVMRERVRQGEYGPRAVTWAEFYAALHAERVERERRKRA